MRKVEAPSDTVFEQNLKEIFSTEENSQTDTQESAEDRQRITFPHKFEHKKKPFKITQKTVRIFAIIGAIGFLVFFLLTVIPKI